MNEERSATLLAVVRRYQEAHPKQAFATADLVDWAVAQHLLSTETAVARALLAEEVNEALASARIQLPDGTLVSEFLGVSSDDSRDLDDQFKTLTERPIEELTLEEARLRQNLENIIERCTQFLSDAAYYARLHPDEPPHPGLDEVAQHRAWAQKQLVALKEAGV
jgi:hypothetical protein